MKLLTNRRIDAAGWNLRPGADDAILTLENPAGAALLHWRGARLNRLAETDATNRKFRLHGTRNGGSAELDMSSVLPFGGEPELRRQLTVGGGILRFRLDFRPGVHEPLRELTAETFELPGAWRRVGLVAIPEAGRTPGAVTWHEVGAETTDFYRAEAPFLALVAERADGTALEIGLGDDLWRWQAGAGAGHSEFAVAGSAAGITVTLRILDYAADAVVERRPWRFTGYVAWRGAAAKSAKSHSEVTVQTMTSEGFPEAALVGGTDGATVPAVCWKAPATRRALKKLLRTVAGTLTLESEPPHACAVAAHLERPGRDRLTHWDYGDMQEFYRWGNGVLAATGGVLVWKWRAADGGAEWTTLPAAAVLSAPPTGLVTLKEQ